MASRDQSGLFNSRREYTPLNLGDCALSGRSSRICKVEVDTRRLVGWRDRYESKKFIVKLKNIARRKTSVEHKIIEHKITIALLVPKYKDE